MELLDEIRELIDEIVEKRLSEAPIPKDGVTPVKYVDYFTTKEIEDIVNEVLLRLPKPKDGIDGKDGRSIVGPQGSQGEPGESIVGSKGDKGDNGKDVVLPELFTKEEVIALIEERFKKLPQPKVVGGGVSSMRLETTLATSVGSNILASVNNIDATSTGVTTLYGVGYSAHAIITGAVVRVTTATNVSQVPTLGIGVASGEDDIFSATALTGVTTTSKAFVFTSLGTINYATHGSVIKLGIDTGAVADAMKISVDLLGYLTKF